MTLSFGLSSPADFDTELADYVDNRVASRLAAGDADLWGPAAREEASKRLAWVHLPETSRPLVPRIEALRAELAAEGVDHVTLAGMGGSSLAPEVVCATTGHDIEILDTTDPEQIAEAIGTDLGRTVLVVASKSGSTVETDTQRRAFEKAFSDAGIDPASRIVVVTDPGSPLDAFAQRAGYRAVFHGDPEVGGRFSALSAFGLVPAGLAGVDLTALLDEAVAIAPALAEDSPENPALRIAAFLSVAHARDTEKLVTVTTDSPVVGFGAWLEQLVAESTGKEGRGVLPVVVEDLDSPGFGDARGDAALLFIGRAEGDHQPVSGDACAVDLPLGALFHLFEHVTAVLGYGIGVNPFDQPDVEAAKKAARALLESPAEEGAHEATFTEGHVKVFGTPEVIGSAESLRDALSAFLGTADEYGYVAVQAFLDRIGDAAAEALRPAVARASGLQTTFGFGPRYLHSTGQYHKGGHANGVFLQITADHRADLVVPGLHFTFGRLQAAQAAGDLSVLAQAGRPVLRLHLTDRAAGIDEVLTALADLAVEQG
ncbi:glucose-6-phosphate isomerase [Brevibacterium litoralis]|uniref:glucose-6-phosphate isomerase n=1 Tax=Brevibacterium litoralis TaxID=3138935 RepID=UPI0032EACDF6